MKEERTFDLRNIINLKDVSFDKEGVPLPYKGNIHELKVNCRPMNENLEPVIKFDIQEDKKIMHNYGHAAHGWTLLFGSVNRAIKEFEEKFNPQELDAIKLNKEITIVGFGCIGLTTTLTLYFKGYKKLKMIGEQKDMITSQMAGGGFNTVPLEKYNDERIINRINKMFVDSFFSYTQIFNGNHVFSEFVLDCVERKTFITNSLDGQGMGLPYLASINLIDSPKKAKLIFGNEASPIVHYGYCFETFMIHTERFCINSFNKIRKLNIPCELKKINSFSEVSSEFIFNCTGLGSFYLNNDKRMYPNCGHGVVIKNQPSEMGLNSRIDFCFSIPKIHGYDHSPNQGKIYMYPKDNCIFIGGTNISRYDGNDDELNKQEWKKLVNRLRYLFHGIDDEPTKFKTKF